MKTNITVLATILIMSVNSFSQNRFLKRKYTKGNFLEKIHHLKHNKWNEDQPLSSEVLDRKGISEEEVKLQLLDIYNSTPLVVKENEKTESAIVQNTITLVEDTINKNITNSDEYNKISKHNTLFVDSNSVLALMDKVQINIISTNNHLKKHAIKCKSLADTTIALKNSSAVPIKHSNNTTDIVKKEGEDGALTKRRVEPFSFASLMSACLALTGGILAFVAPEIILVLGLLTLLVFGILAIIFSTIGLRKIKKGNNKLKGKSIAITGLILGVLSLLAFLAFFTFLIIAFGSLSFV